MSSKTPIAKTKRETKDENLIAKNPEDKLRKSFYSVATPRNFVQKSSAADIYARKNSIQSGKAPKKTLARANQSDNVSPMKDVLKSSPSSVSHISTKSYNYKSVNDSKTPRRTESVPVSSRSMGVAKKVPFTNVTVNSPVIKKKPMNINSETEIGKTKLSDNEKDLKKKEKNRGFDIRKTIGGNVKRDDVKTKQKKISEEKQVETNKKNEIVTQRVLPERKRTKTRTLEEEEIKILTPDVVDNKFEMLNLSKQLTAQPKTFYVELNEQTKKLKQEKPADKAKESDDDVSYEDDFESYESDFDSYQSDNASASDRDSYCQSMDEKVNHHHVRNIDDVKSKEENMLDSGNFELREQRSIIKTHPMDYIVEVSKESDKKLSLTDEGFQEGSSSSGLSSLKTSHIDILDRPLFIDFTKSKENRRKRNTFEKLKRRAEDILSMVTLHEMSYDLYEMQPIPYDLYMATFGRYNYTQTAVQTFEDGITEEIQTDEILISDKWTQHPVEFSYNSCFWADSSNMKKKDSIEDFAYLYNVHNDTKTVVDADYKTNPLRIYLEQKNGVGTNEILPYDSYKMKLKNDEYEPRKLKKFLKKFESKISNILSINSGNTLSNLNKTTKFPFSNDYLLLTTRNNTTESDKFGRIFYNSQIVTSIFSDTKTNLIVTVHGKSSDWFKKCFLCLWDLSLAILEPMKVLIATDDVTIGRFRGSTCGFIVGALCDGTVQLWDLSEEATWYNIVTDEETTKVQHAQILQPCSFTSSAMNVFNNESADRIVGLELMGDSANVDHNKKILAQVCVLQSIGMITIWSIIQEKSKNLKHDLGKALWSKLKLERNQTINLLNHIDLKIQGIGMTDPNFNLNSAKKRVSRKRNERNKNKISRPKSAVFKSKEIDSFDESNVASKKKSIDNSDSWENGLECNHLKVVKANGVENILIAKNGGEVLCCRRYVGSVKIKSLRVASPASSVTRIETSPHGLPYFLAATDCGTVNMCSPLDDRVLLTLDCRNVPVMSAEKCQSDHKGRYVGTVNIETNNADNVSKLPITSVTWLHPNPFCITATFATNVVVWELTFSDIRAKCRSDGITCSSNEKSLALVTKEGDVHVFKLIDPKENNLELFQRYIALL